jgi:two-component system, chemotaxis family, protein-glutamate methylesterase/glutaminase
MREYHFEKKLVLIGSSTGGPLILESIFSGVPKLSCTIIIIQHIRAFFMTDLKSHIQRQTEMVVIVPKDGQNLEVGKIYLAPAERHLILVGNKFIKLTNSDKVNSAKPSIDVTMQSVKDARGLSIMGIVLTGMGKDGSEGLKYLKSIGGITIVQDPSLAPIKTMPENAIATGSVDSICSPEEIKEKIIQF